MTLPDASASTPPRGVPRELLAPSGLVMLRQETVHLLACADSFTRGRLIERITACDGFTGPPGILDHTGLSCQCGRVA